MISIHAPTLKERQLFSTSYGKLLNKHRCVSVGVCEASCALKQMFRGCCSMLT